MSMLPTGTVRPMARMFLRTSGNIERTVENIRPMRRSGVSSTAAASMSAMGAASGTTAERTAGMRPCRSCQAGVATPSR